MTTILRITTLLLVAVAAIEALPPYQGPTKTGKIQHLSEYYANDHPDARPQAPSRPTPINPDIVSEPKPEEKIHIIKDAKDVKDVKEVDKKAEDAPAHRRRRYVDDSEAQDQPTTPKPTRAWWRRMNFARTTEEPEKAPENPKESAEAVKEDSEKSDKDASHEESSSKESTEKKESCESNEETSKEEGHKDGIKIQHIHTEPLPVIQPHVVFK
uniref:Putative cation channel sperm-associated protein 1 isoform x1 n=1 Tax=Lutzomyia longipalpis TaxID=7200 RepID=A0A7G3AD01_LUTLO